MSRVKTWIAVIIALAFISTVTIFDPAYISDAFLSRLVPARAGIQEEDVTVRVTFAEPVPPEVRDVIAKGIEDQAGNPAPTTLEASIESVDLDPPKVTGYSVGLSGDTLVAHVGLSEPVTEKSATAPENFSLAVGGEKESIAAGALSYDPAAYLLSIKAGRVQGVEPGAEYTLVVRNVEDVSGNKLKETTLAGKARPNAEVTRAASAVLDIRTDELGGAVEVSFSGPLSSESAESVLSYSTSAGELPRRVELSPDGKTARLYLKSAAIPEETSLEIKGLADAQGGPVPRVGALAILPAENIPPRATSASATAIEGFENDHVKVTFSEPAIPSDATDTRNYSFESPPGKDVSLAKSSATYAPSSRTATLMLGGDNNLRPTSEFQLKVSGVRDVSANPLQPQTLTGTVGGDVTPPGIEEVVQNLYADETGATIDVALTEPLLKEYLAREGNFSTSGALTPLVLRPSKDLQSVRITYSRPMIPGEVTVRVGELEDPAGNKSKGLTATLAPSELKPPLVLGSTAEAVPGLDDDMTVVVFNEALMSAEAENPENYALRSPLEREINLAGSGFRYVPASRQVVITLRGANLKFGDPYELRVQGIRDIGGNAVKDAVMSSGQVGGDSEPPKIAWARVISRAEGSYLEAGFTEALDPESARAATFKAPAGVEGPLKLSDDGTVVTVRMAGKPALAVIAQGWVFLVELLLLAFAVWLLAAKKGVARLAAVMLVVLAVGLLVTSAYARHSSTVVIDAVADPAGNVAYSLTGVIGSGGRGPAMARPAGQEQQATHAAAPRIISAMHVPKVSQKFVNEAIERRKFQVKASAVDGGSVDLGFSARLELDSAEDIDNYYLDGEVDVQKRPRLAVLLPYETTVRLLFPKALIPGTNTLLVRNVKGRDGGAIEAEINVPIAPTETIPPKISGARATAMTGANNDTVTIFYSEPVISADATKSANFVLESPPGKTVSLQGASLSYLQGLSATSIRLQSALRYGQKYKVSAKGVRDLSGNVLAQPADFQGLVQGDKRPAVLVKALRDTAFDPSGATLDLVFNEAVDLATSAEPGHYMLAGLDARALRAEVIRKVEAPRDEELFHQVDQITETSLAGLLEELTSFPKEDSFKSRAVGYSGDEEAAEFIAKEFQRLGLRKGRYGDSEAGAVVENFPVTVPVDKGARLETETGEKIGLFCLWPNHVKTPSLPAEGVSGRLIYAGNGDFSAFNGQDMDAGPIVVMDFDSGSNYVKARWLGAKAIIFIPENEQRVVQGEAYRKFLQVPVDIPRFWANKEDAERLKALSGRQVKLYARMEWETVQAKNVYAWLPGSTEEMAGSTAKQPEHWADHIVVIEAHYDSMSIAPRLSPGAENACGIAALLEVAQALAAYRPKYTVLFLATSGHFEGLQGIFDFICRHSREESDYYKERIPPEQKINFDVMICLDISSHNDQVAAFSEGNFVKFLWNLETLRRNVLSPFIARFTEHAKTLWPEESAGATPRFVDAVSPKGRSWRTYMPALLGLDHEAASFTGNVALSFATPGDLRERVDTPYDRVEYLNLPNLAKQVRTIAGLVMKASRDEKLFTGSKLRIDDLGRAQSGNIVWFDRSVNFFVPKGALGGAVVAYESIVPSQPRVKSYAGVRALMTTQTAATDPGWNDGNKGFKLVPTTANARRFEVRVWDPSVRKPARGGVTVATPHGIFYYPLKDDDGDGVWAAEVDGEAKLHSVGSAYALIYVFGPVLLFGFLLYRKRDLDMRARRVAGTVALLVALVIVGWSTFLATREELLPAGAKPVVASLEPTVKSIVLTDGTHTFSVREDIRARFGNFTGQFRFPVKVNQLPNVFSAYALDENGEIVFAPDRGEEGDKTYSMSQPFGWWESEMLEVLFPCRAVSIFEAVDSRYLTVLDSMLVLGPDDATPQSFGYDYVSDQSQVEGEAVDAAVIYAKREADKPPSRIKVLMSTGLLGIKYLLTNAPEKLLEEPVKPGDVTQELLTKARGAGYPSDTEVILRPSFAGAKDMWVIDDVRMKQLEAYGIRNEKLQDLHDRARDALMSATEDWKAKKYDSFVAESREAAGLESRGYPDVKKTANDTVKGVIFYFTLLLPFSVFVERLVFGFVDIRKRIAGFAGVFVLVFIVLHFVHPAFKLSTSPYIIFLAFVMLALGGIVLALVMSKFNQEVKKMKRAAAGVYEADVGRISATAAAVMLGISNLRKRKVRTALTAATLTLLTFTVLSFTSVVTAMKFYRLPRSNYPIYQGMLVRDRNWKALQPSVTDYVASAFREKAKVIPRAWYIAKVRTETEVIDVRNPANDKATTASALLGLSPEEALSTKPDQLLVGEKSDWFRKGDYKVCILPNDMAGLLGITADEVGRQGTANVWMLGTELKVIGLVDSERFNKLRDLDDEKLTPVDMAAEATRIEEGLRESPQLAAAEPIQAFSHLESSNVALVPYNFLVERGGTPRSIAITGFIKADLVQEVEDFLSRVALTVFVGKGDRVTVYSSMGATSIKASANLVIPILIAALIVLNTMLGAVYERIREIGVYSSVGLAPTHVGALFLAEAAVFATLGAVIGYLIGQVATLALANVGLLKGMFLNYSSLSAVWSTVVVMATVLISALYPAKKAADLAVPDVTRRWKVPEPKGDQWVFDFPFTMSGKEVLGMHTYLAKVFDTYTEGSTGGFVAEDVKLDARMFAGEPEYTVSMRSWLAPYDLGISQEVKLMAIPTGEFNIYKIEVHLVRLSGDVASWKRINRGFLNMLRKRFLVWRTVPPEEKTRYQEEGQDILASRVERARPG